jgi:hypothetical protein
MSSEVKNSRVAYIAQSLYMPSRFPKEVDNLFGVLGQAVPKYKRGDHDRDKLVEEDGNFRVE